MSFDPRLTPANDRVAAAHLAGQVQAERFVEGERMQCVATAADILDAPNGRRTSQILYGQSFLVLETVEEFVFGQCLHDGYVGYMRASLVAPSEPVTHWIAAPQTHTYPGADMKLTSKGALYFGSEVAVVREEGDWSQLNSGHYVPTGHLLPIKQRLADPADVADLFLGTPYLWGGVTRYGIDCSGLVQVAWRACGLDCPRDSDMQEAEIGKDLAPGSALQRGDLVFWKGHVALMAGPDRMLHANAHHMSVVFEPFEDACARIAASGGGEVTRLARPDLG